MAAAPSGSNPSDLLDPNQVYRVGPTKAKPTRILPQPAAHESFSRIRVASSISCKLLQGFSFPGAVQAADGAEDGAVAALGVGEAADGVRSASHLAEGALDNIRGADLPRMGLGQPVEAEQLPAGRDRAFHKSRRDACAGGGYGFDGPDYRNLFRGAGSASRQ